MRLGILIACCLGVQNLLGQLSTSSTVCVNENLPLIADQSPNVLWDFCGNELENSPSTIDLTTLDISRANNFKLLYDTLNQSYHGFLADFGSAGNDPLYRLDYGNSLDNIPTTTEMILNGDGLNDPDGLDIILGNDGNWYGFVGSVQTNHGITRLDFGNSLTNQPVSVNLGNFDLNDRVRELKVVDKRYLVLLGYSSETFNIIDFSNGISATETSTFLTSSFPKLSNAAGFDIKNVENNWVVLVVSINDSRMLRLNFGTNLLSNPIEERTYNLGLSGHYKLNWIIDSNHYALVSNFNSGPTLISLEDFGISTNFTIKTSLGPQAYGIDLVYSSGSYHAPFWQTSNGAIKHLIFESFCNETLSFSPEASPIISYSSNRTVQLKKFTGDEIEFEEITITSSIAPSISFITDNACVTFEGNFDASTPDLTYTWNFGDGSPTENGQNTSHQFASAGTYTVRLEVDDGTCGNFTEQEITIYEEPPVPDFEVVGLLCADGEITFNNLTDDGLYEGPLTYTWDFNGQSTTNTRDASFVFGSPGTKSVTLTTSIPGCENTMEVQIELQPGPTSQFSSSSVCQNELLTFTNQSSNADSYLWDFGDGFTSTQANASHIYTESGNFMVSLEAIDTDGCTAIFEQEVAISPEPDASFSYDVACTGNQGVEFFDQSTVSGADILEWEWRVNDEFISDEQNPTLSFDETGNVIVSLTVTSSNGCLMTYEETLNVQKDPDPAISSDVSCQSLVSTFTDISANAGNIVSRVWEIEGQTYTTAEVEHTFSGTGQIDVSLTVTGDNFCSSTLYTTVNVTPATTMEFSVSSYCDNDQIILQDQSTSPEAIVSRTWTLDDSPFFNGSTAVIEELAVGTYTLGLTTVTESGCTFQSEQTIEIFEGPEADFTSSATYGVPPFTLNLTNSSSGANSYSWRVNGSEISTSNNTSYIITEEGNFIVELVAQTNNGCEDTQTMNVISRLPAINLAVSNLSLTPSGTSQNISLRVTNNGNLPVEIFDIFVSSSSDFSFSERINEYIGIGEQVNVQLASALQNNSAQRICVKIQSAYDDINPDTNEACINFTPRVVFEDIYPNPFQDEAVVRFILPESGKVRIRIANTTGKLMINDTYNLEEGLQILRFNSTRWEKGLYFVTVLYNDEMTTKRVLRF